MGELHINNSDNYEPICRVTLSKEKHPIAYQHKVDELMRENEMTQEEAEKVIADMVVELEVYYQDGFGLFAVDSEFCECTDVMFSPYNGEAITAQP